MHVVRRDELHQWCPVPYDQLAILVAALAATSPHTINPSIDRASLATFASGLEAPLPDSVLGLLGD